MSSSNLAPRCSEGSTLSAAPAHQCGQSLWIVLVVLLASLVVIKYHQKLPLFSLPGSPRLPLLVSIDSESYLAMAKDGLSQIASPFSKRVLYPWLAGTISRATGQSLGGVFLTLNGTALLGLAFCLAEILRVTVGRPWLALLFLLTPFPLEIFELAYLPDLFHMALVSLYFLLLLRQKNRWALLVLFVAFLTREDTLLLCLCTAGLGWFRAQKRLSFQAGGILCAGMGASSVFCQLGKPNIHHLPDFLYLLGKVPYYLALNFSGFRVWSNVRPEEGTPFAAWTLPPWLHIGTDSVIGLAYPNWRYPVDTLIVLLTIFGVGPLLLIYVMWKGGKTRALPFVVELALIYGVVSYLIGPLLGDWVDRLVGYGWPAFWIALPCLFFSSGWQVKPLQAALLGAGYWLACWWPRFFGYGNDRSLNPWPCFGVIVIYLFAGSILRRIKKSPAAKLPH